MRIVKIRFVVEVTYDDDREFLSDKVAMLLREIADYSEKSVRDLAEKNHAGVTRQMPSGAFSWEPVEV